MYMKVFQKISLKLACLTALVLPANLFAQNGTPGKPVIDTIRDKTVTLSWHPAEEIYGIFDDFEGHTDFAINSPGTVGWQYADMDHDREYLVGECQFEGAQLPSAFRVWNPSKTIPAYTVPRGFPHSGERCLISFATMNDFRNDWLISPDLTKYNFTDSIRLSFWARTFNSAYGGLEQIKIGYSTTDAKVSSFTFLNGGEPYEVPEAYPVPETFYFEFKFPSTAKFVAINCVTNSGQALIIDDVAIGTNKVMPNKGAHNYLLGYNLYRNNAKVNTDLLTQTTYIDNAPNYGNVAYVVEAVFEDGTTKRSETLNSEIPDIRILPFTERWNDFTLTENFWKTNPDKIDAYGRYQPGWKVDYREGGLIIPAATFAPPFGDQNYHDYWLESKELSGVGLDGVMLCYEMAFWRYNGTGGGSVDEYIKVEVWDGTQWVTVQTVTSADDSFDYTRFYLDISQYVKGKYFKIRFNGGGRDPFCVHGWYITYVKVYEKEKATVSGTVTCDGTPVAGADITWTSADGDVYKTVSGANGAYSIADVDANTYSLTVTKNAYNPLLTENITVAKGTKSYDIAMTQPAVAAPAAEEAYTLVAEATQDGQLSLQNTGNGPVRVNIDIDYANLTTQQAPALKTLKTFRPKDLMQAVIAFDGTYFYTAPSDEYTGDGVIEKYDRDGNFIESFQPSIHVRRYFGFAFDGQDFYTVHNDNIIRRLDLEKKEFIGEIVTDIENINHIAYDEERDAFYVGCLNSIALVDKNGKTLEKEVVLTNAKFVGSVYDPYFKTGPTMWILDQNEPNNVANGYTTAVVRRFDLNTKTVRNDYTFDCSQLPGFIYGNGKVGRVWGEGMFGTTRYLDGHFVIMGVMLSDPGLIFILDMYDVENWLRPSTYRTEIAAGASLTIPYTVDAANLADGTSREATMRILFDPAIPARSQKIKVNVSGKATLAKPTDLTATVQNDEKAVLTWTAADAPTAPASYNIYRDGGKIATVNALTYTDNNLKAGFYRYEVSAVYAGGESKMSNAAEAEIVNGIACYKPHDLKARNVRNEEIVLSWENPSAVGDKPAALTWSNGHLYDYINMRDNSTIIGANQWLPEDLADYRDMRISAVTFVPMTSDGQPVPSTGQFTLYIWEDGDLKYQQTVTEGFTIMEPYKLTLSQPYTVNDRKTLRVGIEASGCHSVALGIDNGPAKVGKGDWIFNENLGGWITLHAAGSSDGNFIISLDLMPKTQPEANTTKSYNVFRNGEQINTAPVTETTFTDKPVAGNYIYTVTAVHDNCESYASNAAKSRIVDLKAHDAPEDLTANVKMNRDVRLNWNYPNYKLSGETKAGYEPFGYVTDMTLSNSGEVAIVTDGQYIYTSFFNRGGDFNKYDLNGNFIESFNIEGIAQILDLTWDGQYFYGGKGTTTLYCMDFENRKLVKTMTVTDAVRHCTYIPDLDNGRGGFEIGDWTSSYFVSMEGLYLNGGYQSPVGAFGSAYYDGKLYYFQQRPSALCEIIEVDFATLEATGNRADLNLYSQFKVGEEARAGGLGMFTSLNGSMMLLANIQNGANPNKVVWVEVTPNEFVTGFNLYRNNTKVNKDPLTDREYIDILTTPGTYSYTVSAIFVDGVEGDKTDAVSVKIVEAKHCEAPANVKAVVTDRDVRLQWTVALEEEVAKDDIESYTNLAKPFGKYITVDADNKATYVPADWTYADAGKASSFLVLDQRALTPAQKNLAFSGNKVIAVFGAAPVQGVDVSYAHDWLIMPAATQTGGETQWISFMARSLDLDSKEAFRVAYSMTDADTSSFIRLSQKSTYINGMWSRYTFNLPANIKYVAIEYTSPNGKAMFIDDISVGSGACVFEVDESLDASETFVEKVAGYTVLRDNTPLMTNPVHANTYFDGNLKNGTYYYAVKATYNTSCVSAASEPIMVKVDFKAPQNTPSNLQGAQRKRGDVYTDTVDLSWRAPQPVPDKSLSYVMSDLEDAIGFTTATTYYVAQKWEASDLLGVYGYRIEAVNAFFGYAPDQLDLLIYQDDELVYEQTVTRMCEDMNVSTFILDEPFEVDFSKSLTVGFRIDADEMTFTIGYDAGPAMPNGDLFCYDGINWRSGEYALGVGNWFMAVMMRMPEPAGGYETGFKGYLVYRDGEAVRKELISDTKYIDHGLENGIHTYAVSAVYNDGEQITENISVRVIKVANEELDENNLYIFPNPASDYFTVYGSFTGIEITDLQGKVQLKHEAAQGADVSVATLMPGMYFVRISAEAGTTVRKLVVK